MSSNERQSSRSGTGVGLVPRTQELEHQYLAEEHPAEPPHRGSIDPEQPAGKSDAAGGQQKGLPPCSGTGDLRTLPPPERPVQAPTERSSQQQRMVRSAERLWSRRKTSSASESEAVALRFVLHRLLVKAPLPRHEAQDRCAVPRILAVLAEANRQAAFCVATSEEGQPA